MQMTVCGRVECLPCACVCARKRCACSTHFTDVTSACWVSEAGDVTRCRLATDPLSAIRRKRTRMSWARSSSSGGAMEPHSGLSFGVTCWLCGLICTESMLLGADRLFT